MFGNQAEIFHECQDTKRKESDKARESKISEKKEEGKKHES